MTKETILENNLREFAEIGMGTFDKERYDADVSTGQIEPFYKSMDEYSKEVAIDFRKWENKVKDEWFYPITVTDESIESLFEFYLIDKRSKQIAND